jgi:DNA mismatch repair protein MutS2
VVGDAAIREASRALDRVASSVAIGGELESVLAPPEVVRAHVDAATLKRGSRVYVPKLRAECEVLERNGDELRVAAGALKLTVRVSEVRRAGEADIAPVRARRAPAAEAPRDVEVPIQTSENSCDLRGMRADDGVSMMTSFLDRCVGSGVRLVFVIHGHGTGALREAVRKEVASSTYVARARPGETGEGGDGVTLVWLR